MKRGKNPRHDVPHHPIDLALQVAGLGMPLLSIAGLALAQNQIDYYDVESYPMGLGITDVTGDGAPDILAPCRDSSNDVALLVNQGDGAFDPAQFIFSGTSPRAIATGDYNKDGWMDYVICNQDQHLTVFINQQDGTFVRTRFAVDAPRQGGQPRFVKTGDLDGDGDLDLIIPISTQDYYANWWAITTFTNDGAGNFTQNDVQVVDGLNTVRGFDVGDLDGDGDLDIALGLFDYHPCQQPYCYEYHAEGQTLAVLTNEGAGNPLSIQYLNLEFLTEDLAISDVAIVDLNGDGRRDIVAHVADFEESVDLLAGSNTNIQIFMNQGGNSFAPAHTIWTEYEARGHGMAARDLEGDGDIDLVVGAAFRLNQPITLFALVNSGNGVNWSVQPFDLGPPRRYPLTFAMTDISGDGQNDIIAGMNDPASIMCLINATPFAGATLEVSPSLVRGQSADFTISNAPFHKPFFLIYSFDDPAPSAGLRYFGGLTMDIPGPSYHVLASGMTGVHGTAHINVNVPNIAPLRNITIQAVIRDGANGGQSIKTNYQVRRIQQ